MVRVFTPRSSLPLSLAEGYRARNGSSDAYDLDSATDCQISEFYAHSPAAEASQLVRRRLRDVATDENKYCPLGLTPCRIAGSDGYEVRVLPLPPSQPGPDDLPPSSVHQHEHRTRVLRRLLGGSLLNRRLACVGDLAQGQVAPIDLVRILQQSRRQPGLTDLLAFLVSQRWSRSFEGGRRA